jgi:hypothetical protein
VNDVELEPSVWIPVGAGGAVVFLVLGWLLHALRGRRLTKTVAKLEAQLDTAIHEREDALAAARQQIDTTNAVRDELAAERRRSSEIEAEAAMADEHAIAVADIVGLEAEVTSLRVLAARAKGLEARLAELESDVGVDIRQPAAKTG